MPKERTIQATERAERMGFKCYYADRGMYSLTNSAGVDVRLRNVASINTLLDWVENNLK